MKKAAIIIICLLIALFALGQTNIEEIQVTPPKYAGPEFMKLKKQIETFDTLNDYLKSIISYPAKAQEMKREGVEVIQFIVNPDGTLSDFTVINSVSPEIDDEVISSLQATSGLWLPGYNNSEPISMEKEVSIAFSIYPDEPTQITNDFVDLAKKYYKKGNRALFEKGKVNKAIKLYDEALNYMPNETCILAIRGLCKFEINDQDGACKDWTRVKTLGGIEGDYLLDNYCEMKGFEEMLGLLEAEN